MDLEGNGCGGQVIGKRMRDEEAEGRRNERLTRSDTYPAAHLRDSENTIDRKKEHKRMMLDRVEKCADTRNVFSPCLVVG